MNNYLALFIGLLLITASQSLLAQSTVEEFYRIDNLSNPIFTKIDQTKAKSLIDDLERRFKENEKLKIEAVFPKKFNLADLGVEVYVIKLGASYEGMQMMSTAYTDTKMMDPSETSYNPTRAGQIMESASSMTHSELKGSSTDGFVILKAKGFKTDNPNKELTAWVTQYLDGIFKQSGPKLKLSVANNELSFCLGMGKIHTFKDAGTRLSAVQVLNTDGELVAFGQGAGNKYCVITSNGNADQTNMHFFQGSNGSPTTIKNLKIWDAYKQDKLQKRPYPTLDYANGEFLFQYYIHMWEASMNTNLHSASFRLKIKDDGSAESRTWQTSHTFGMDALHNGTDWVALYATDGDFYLNHPGVFIDKFDKKQKALLFSAPQRWAEPGVGDAAHGQMNYFYTGLGGIAYDGSGYAAVLNNPKMTTAPTNLPQNVGFVYVKGDYSATPRRNNGDLAPVDPTANLMNIGNTDDVTIYNERMNTEPVSYKRKVKWLSDYSTIENGFSNNTDIVALGNNFIVLWEKWAKVGQETNVWSETVPIWEHLSTEAVVVDKNGNVLKTKSLGKYPLNDWDDLKVWNGKVLWATFEEANFTISINTLDADLNLISKKLSVLNNNATDNPNTLANTTTTTGTTGSTTTTSTTSSTTTTTTSTKSDFTQGTIAQELTCGSKFIRATDGKIYEQIKGVWTHIGDRCKSLDCKNGQAVCTSEDNSLWYYKGNPFEWTNNPSTTPIATTQQNTLNAGATLAEGAILVSANGAYQLIMQTDGHLVIYTKAGVPVWGSGTNSPDNGGSKLIMQTDGHLVIYNGAGTPTWGSGTHGMDAVKAEITNDGKLVLYSSTGAVVWVNQ